MSFGEDQIDPNFKAMGLANGSVVERDATFDEELAACHRKREAEYPSLGDQLDAAFKARQGNSTSLQEIDALIVSIKSKYPKPVPQEAAPAPAEAPAEQS